MMAKLVALTTLVVLAAGLATDRLLFAEEPVHQPADVLIRKGGMKGSGAHIGDGYILTASHVVANEHETEQTKKKPVRVKLKDGEIRDLEVLWINKDYDISLTHLDNYAGLPVTPLLCRDPRVGEPVTSYGNPMDFQHLVFHGFVSGEPQEWGHYKRVTPIDSSLIWGMSGGPVLDKWGNLIGIMVATEIKQWSEIDSAWVRIGLIVPGTDLCKLMGRK